MIEPTSLGTYVNSAEFMAKACRAITCVEVENLLAQLPITPEDSYMYDRDNPEAGWQAGKFHWIPVGGDRGNAGRIKQANQPVNPIAERAINGMEAIIELARHRELISKPTAPAPSSPRDAVTRYFGLPSLDEIPRLDDSQASKETRSRARELARHQGTERVTGSKTADMRSALVDYFHEQGRIMIATEAGAEGINLQFCSLVVNYDLPWNPQRIEQRIGRCHRYGQKHDVVVVNFINRKNEADKRVFELLSEKFKLFEGVFGASDEVLGAIESGVDFEKRIAAIYQGCRKHEEIKAAFDQLQLELSFEINETMTQTRRKLLDNFDDEVREKLKVSDEASKAYLNRYERLLMQLTRHELSGHAEFIDDSSFKLKSCPFPSAERDIPLGLYELPRRSGEAHLYRLHHPLAEAVMAQAKAHELPVQEVHFSYGGHDGKVTTLEPLIGKSGWLTLSSFTIESLDQAEDYLIFAAVADDGMPLDEDTASRLFTLPGQLGNGISPGAFTEALNARTHERQAVIRKSVSERNARFFEAEAEKLDGWADDIKLGLEREIKELDRQIKEARRAATSALSLEEKLSRQKEIKALESQRKDKRMSLFEAQDKIDEQRDELIANIEGKLNQKAALQQVFCIRWKLI